MKDNESSTYREFDRSRLRLKSLDERHHDLDLTVIKELRPVTPVTEQLTAVAHDIVAARARGAAVVLMIGGHVIRSGVQRYLIDLMQKGYITCLATNGAGVIHDYEFAKIGKTTESVARYIKNGQFGLWRETGEINEIITRGASMGQGIGESVGRQIEESSSPARQFSLFAAAWRYRVVATVHVSIGYDIVHEHPNCDGGAWGEASYRDFLRFTHVLEGLSGGVVMNFGSAVMAPEVFLKGLAMVRNVARQDGRDVTGFTSLVCDLKKLPGNFRSEACKSHPDYYFRPWKTMLVRSLGDADGSYYVRGDHASTIPALWTAITGCESTQVSEKRCG